MPHMDGRGMFPDVCPFDLQKLVLVIMPMLCAALKQSCNVNVTFAHNSHHQADGDKAALYSRMCYPPQEACVIRKRALGNQGTAGQTTLSPLMHHLIPLAQALLTLYVPAVFIMHSLSLCCHLHPTQLLSMSQICYQ